MVRTYRIRRGLKGSPLEDWILDKLAESNNERKPWRAPHDGGYHPSESTPEPTVPPPGPAGTSGGKP